MSAAREEVAFPIHSLLRWILGVIAVAVMGAPLRAEQAPTEPAPLVLSRAEVVRRASSQNPQVASQRAEVAKYEALKGQVKAARWPAVTLDLGVGPSLKASRVPGTAVASTQNQYSDVTLDDFTATVATRISVTQALYTFGKIDYRLEAAEHGMRSAEHQVAITRAEVALEALRLYESYLFARDTAQFLDEVEYTVGKSIETTQEQLEWGAPDVSESDLLRLQSALAVARLGLSQARAGMVQADAGLRAYLALGAEVSWTPADERLEPAAMQPTPVEELVVAASEHRPEILALGEGIEAYQRLADAEFADYWPNFFAALYISAAYTPGRDLVDTRFVVDPLYHFTPILFVGLRWTFQADMPSRRADQMRAEVLRLTELRAWALQGIPAQVRVAHEAVQRARRDVETGQGGVDKAKKWLVSASADYAAGFTDSRSLTDAVQAYATLRLAKMDALFRLNVALAELHEATGTLEPSAFVTPPESPSPPSIAPTAPVGEGAGAPEQPE